MIKLSHFANQGIRAANACMCHSRGRGQTTRLIWRKCWFVVLTNWIPSQVHPYWMILQNPGFSSLKMFLNICRQDTQQDANSDVKVRFITFPSTTLSSAHLNLSPYGITKCNRFNIAWFIKVSTKGHVRLDLLLSKLRNMSSLSPAKALGEIFWMRFRERSRTLRAIRGLKALDGSVVSALRGRSKSDKFLIPANISDLRVAIWFCPSMRKRRFRRP